MTKILLVDDSKFLRMATERALARKGYIVVTASDGPKGIELANSAKPDVILLDMLLPGMTGPDVLKAQKSSRDRADSRDRLHWLVAKERRPATAGRGVRVSRKVRAGVGQGMRHIIECPGEDFARTGVRSFERRTRRPHSRALIRLR